MLNYSYVPSNNLGKCGNDCGNCGLHVTNLRTVEDRQIVATSVSKYINWNPTPEKLKVCSGCQAKTGFLYLPNCVPRQCCLHSGFQNCAHCTEFPCPSSPTLDIKPIETKIGGSIPESDFRNFVGPWTSSAILTEYQQKLKKSEIKPPRPYEKRPKMVEFPKFSARTQKEISALRFLHDLILKIQKSETTSYARAQTEILKQTFVSKLLFSMGKYGSLEVNRETVRKGISIQAEDYAVAMKGVKFRAEWTQIGKKFFPFMEPLGLGLSLMHTDSKRSGLTAKNNLRKTGWKLYLTFKKHSELDILHKILNEWVGKLLSLSPKSAFTKFKRGDLTCMVE